MTESAMSGNRTAEQRGFVLLVVMWLLILLSGIAIGMATTVRTDSRLARNQLEEARARHLAQGAIHLAVMRLMGPERDPSADAWDAPAETVTVLGAPVRVRIVDECAKVDMNAGWGLLVQGIAAQAAGDEDRAAAGIGPAILDWRDPDGRRRLKGAEDDAYSDAGLPFGARDGLMESIEEVRMVLGVTPAIYDRLAPLITVDCLNAGVDPILAPPSVLSAVPGIKPAALAAFLDARAHEPVETAEILAQTLTSDDKYFEISRKAAFTVFATVELSPGAPVSWRAIVRLTGDPARPFLFRSWTRIPSERALAPGTPRKASGEGVARGGPKPAG